MISDEIRRIIKKERIKQGLSKEELARKAGLSVRLIDYWEQDKRKATNIESIDKALSALGIEYTIGHRNIPSEETSEVSNEVLGEISEEVSIGVPREVSNEIPEVKSIPTIGSASHQRGE